LASLETVWSARVRLAWSAAAMARLVRIRRLWCARRASRLAGLEMVRAARGQAGLAWSGPVTARWVWLRQSWCARRVSLRARVGLGWRARTPRVSPGSVWAARQGAVLAWPAGMVPRPERLPAVRRCAGKVPHHGRLALGRLARGRGRPVRLDEATVRSRCGPRWRAVRPFRRALSSTGMPHPATGLGRPARQAVPGGAVPRPVRFARGRLRWAWPEVVRPARRQVRPATRTPPWVRSAGSARCHVQLARPGSARRRVRLVFPGWTEARRVGSQQPRCARTGPHRAAAELETRPRLTASEPARHAMCRALSVGTVARVRAPRVWTPPRSAPPPATQVRAGSRWVAGPARSARSAALCPSIRWVRVRSHPLGNGTVEVPRTGGPPGPPPASGVPTSSPWSVGGRGTVCPTPPRPPGCTAAARARPPRTDAAGSSARTPPAPPPSTRAGRSCSLPRTEYAGPRCTRPSAA